MCNAACILFAAKYLDRGYVKGKKVIEVGSCDINGSLRPLIESWGPAEYVGGDIAEGKGVDAICRVEDLLEKFGRERFDIVVSTEMLEHVRDWRKAVSNLKHICKTGGMLLLTTRAQGTEYHGHPYDFWRYETEDMKRIFSDFVTERIEGDPYAPGVLIKAVKPAGFTENDLSALALYSVITGKRAIEIDHEQVKSFHRKYASQQRLRTMAAGLFRAFFGPRQRGAASAGRRAKRD